VFTDCFCVLGLLLLFLHTFVVFINEIIVYRFSFGALDAVYFYVILGLLYLIASQLIIMGVE